MTDTDKSRLSEILSRQEKREPWQVVECDDGMVMIASPGDVICVPECNHPIDDLGDRATFAGIVQDRADIPWLTSKLQAAWDRIAWLESSLTQAEERGLERALVAVKDEYLAGEGLGLMKTGDPLTDRYDQAITDAANSIRAIMRTASTPESGWVRQSAFADHEAEDKSTLIVLRQASPGETG